MAKKKTTKRKAPKKTPTKRQPGRKKPARRTRTSLRSEPLLLPKFKNSLLASDGSGTMEPPAEGDSVSHPA